MAKKSEPAKGLNWFLWIVAAAILIGLIGGIAVIVISRRSMTRDERLVRRGALALERKDTDRALTYFDEAVESNPANLEAWGALISTLTSRRQFDDATKAIARAVENGLDDATVESLKADIHVVRAEHRIRSSARGFLPEICEKVIQEEIDPAAKILTALAEQAEAPAQAYSKLGDVYQRKADLLSLWRRELEQSRSDALKLRKEQEASEIRVRALELLAEMRAAVLRSRVAYGKAIKADPKLQMPRLALAQQYLRAYMPNAGAALKVLEPILAERPHQPDALLLSGVAERLMGNKDKALEYFRAVPEGSSARQAALMNEADLLLEMGRTEEAAPLTQQLQSQGSRDARSIFLRAKVLIRSNQVEQAIPLLQNLFGNDPQLHWPEARHELAQALLRTGKREQGLEAFRNTVADVDVALPTTSASKRAELLELKYAACMLMAEELQNQVGGEALDYANRAFVIFPARTEPYELFKKLILKKDPKAQIDPLLALHVGRLYADGQFDKAMAVIQADRNLLKDRMRAERMKAACLVGRGDFTQAIKVYEDLLRANPDESARIQMEMARLYIGLNRMDEAEAVYRRLLEEDPHNPQIAAQLAALLLRTGQSEAASKLLAAEAESGKSGEELILALLRLYVQTKEYDAAIDLIKGQMAERPKDPMLPVLVAQLYWSKEDRANARTYYDEALTRTPLSPMAYNRMLLDMVEGKFTDAVALGQKAMKESPDVRALQLYLAVAYQGLGDVDRAEAYLEAAMKDVLLAAGGKRGAFLMRDVLRAGGGNFKSWAPDDEAKPGKDNPDALPTGVRDTLRFLSVLNAMPAEQRKEAALAFNVMTLLMYVPALNEAKAQVATIEKLMPDEPLPLCEKALLLDRLGLHDDAISEYDRVIASHPDYLTAWFRKAESHIRRGDNEKAIDVLEDVLKKDLTEDQRAKTVLVLGSRYLAANRDDLALSHLKVATQYPATAPWAYNNVAWILAARKQDPDAALPYALKAVEKLPDSAQLLDTLGWVYVLKEDPQKAIPVLRNAARLLTDNPRIRYHLAQAYLAADRKAEGLKEMEQALAIGGSFPEMGKARQILKAAGREPPPASLE